MAKAAGVRSMSMRRAACGRRWWAPIAAMPSSYQQAARARWVWASAGAEPKTPRGQARGEK